MSTFFILVVKDISPTKHEQKKKKKFLKGQKRERALVHNLPDTLVLESILARRCVPTLGGL